MCNYYVYRWIRLDKNQPFYIGKGKGNRAFYKKGRNNYFTKILNKFDCKVEIFITNLTEKQALKKEIEFIELYRKSNIKLVNMTDGGEGKAGCIPSTETRRKLSETLKKLAPSLREQKSLIGKSRSKELMSKCTMLGKHHTPESKAKIGKANSGRPMTEENKKRLSSRYLGRNLPEETKRKMSITRLNMSQEKKQKIKDAQDAARKLRNEQKKPIY